MRSYNKRRLNEKARILRWNLVNRKELSENEYETTYDWNGWYFITVADLDDTGSYDVTIRPNIRDHMYAPNVFTNSRKEYVIDTTSYGTLSVEDVEELVESYNTAIRLIDDLYEEFPR